MPLEPLGLRGNVSFWPFSVKSDSEPQRQTGICDTISSGLHCTYMGGAGFENAWIIINPANRTLKHWAGSPSDSSESIKEANEGIMGSNSS